MLIPIGFFGAGAAAGAYELISTAYGTGSSGTITFSSIPSTYKHLQIRATARATAGGDINTMSLRFNSDSSAVYATHSMHGDGGGVYSAASTSLTGIELQYVSANSTLANVIMPRVIDILDYASSSKNKTTREFAGLNYGSSAGSYQVSLKSGLWINTSAVNTLTFTLGSGSFTTASRFSLYGIKG